MSFYCFNSPLLLEVKQFLFIEYLYFFFHASSRFANFSIFKTAIFFYISSLFISLFALLSRSFIVKVCSTYPLYLNYATYVQIMTLSSTTPMRRMSQLEQCSFSSVPHLISARRLEWDSSSVALILWGHLKSYLFHKVSSNYTGFFNSLTSQYQGIHDITLHQFK